MRLTFICSLFFLLSGCESLQLAQPLEQHITAAAENDVKRIFWLDERANQPEKLTLLTLLGDLGQTEQEYRWREGVIREIERRSELLIDGQIKKQSAQIRYDKDGQAIYQKYFVNNEVLPLKNAQLNAYYQEALAAYQTAKDLIKNETVFFQGYVKSKTFISCNRDEEKLLSISDPLRQDVTLSDQEQFIAAVGVVGFVRNTAKTVIALKNAEFACFTRPMFPAP